MERQFTRKIARKPVSVLAASACALLVVVTGVAPTLAQQASTATRRVVVVIENLRSDRGELVGGLYTSSRHWIAENRAASDCHAPIHAGVARCEFDVPLTRRVAFAGMHDEDSDGQLDRDFLGIPQEGYAFSNDAREPFGPPSFEAASFSPPEVRPFIVHARYGI
jgi:uncharacterized protein (DUF2141 family)